MGSREEQKQSERFLLERFLEHQGISPRKIKQPDPPDPDFLVDIEGRTVGIELTEVFVQPATHPRSGIEPLPQELESITNRIVSRARKVYLEAGNPPVASKIVFSTRIALDKNLGDEIANLIAGKVRSMSLNNPQMMYWSSNEPEKDTDLSAAVASIRVLGVPELRLARWTVARAGLVATLTEKHLLDRVEAKIKKVNGYKAKTAEVWLLIVADRARPSQKFELPPNLSLDSLSSGFTKRFYYGYGTDDVIEF